ncbi:MAG: bifunctional DNA-formamidopyrimidine glycosylase/DNA-(apurinic or apyrimidinic site) lyase [Candidatus Saccharicenans sp.]
MPELPEVETVVRDLRAALRGKKIKEMVFFSPHLEKRQPASAPAPDRYLGKKIVEIRRRGKMIIFEIEGGLGLLVHLKMTGQLILCSPARPSDKHTHARMSFYGIRKELRFRDVRKFGFLTCLNLCDISQKVDSSLGPEPLAMNFSDFRKRLLVYGKKKIKSWLLDQKIIAGIGNIYSDEILFRAGLRPERMAGSLDETEARRLWNSMRFILKKAISLRGSSVSDYVDATGETGRFQLEHRVYGKGGEVCRRCRQSVIERKKIGGRSSYFCPACQK